jgi:hypothetical protein
MDKELQELEAELKRLRPVMPSRELTAAIGRDLAVPEARRNFWAWAALPLAAAAAGVLLLQAPRTSPSVPSVAPTAPVAQVVTPAAKFKPVTAENVLYAQSDDGLVTLADGSTAVRYRRSYVDTITWRNPNTQASLRWSVPRTEERVVPVSFQ